MKLTKVKIKNLKNKMSLFLTTKKKMKFIDCMI